MIFRAAQKNDFESIQQIVDHYLGVAFNWPRELFSQEFNSADVWVVEESGEEICAFCCVRDVVDAWEISILATHPEFRRKGIMKKLLSQMIEHYRSGFLPRPFWLEVHEDNQNAQAFYEKFGFVKEGRRGGYYRDGSAALLYTFPKDAQIE